MRIRNEEADKEALRRYEKASSAMSTVFVGYFVVSAVCKYFDLWDSPVFFTVGAAVLAIPAGIVAYLHYKLPKRRKEKPRIFGVGSVFTIHPYVTFGIFVSWVIYGLYVIASW